MKELALCERGKQSCSNILRLSTVDQIFLPPQVKQINPQEKLIIVVQEQDGICIADTEKLENLPRLVFIDNECGNANVVVDGRELTRNITKKRISIVLKAYRSPLCGKCDR